MTSHDIKTLCAAIDAGDDSALLPLADALEEAGDNLAAWVRRVVRSGAVPHDCGMHDGTRGYGWISLVGSNGITRWDDYVYPGDNYLSDHRCQKLPPPDHPAVGGDVFIGMSGHVHFHYRTRSAAYLALAEALTK